MKRISLFLLVAVALPLASPGRAQAGEPVTAEQRAHEHFEAGRALYHTGNYEEAMREFAIGYDLANKPEFFINIGLCHYRLGHLKQAREQFRRFLGIVAADNPSRAYVEEQLGEVEQALRAQEQSPPIVEPPHTKALAHVAPAVPPASANAATSAGVPWGAASPGALTAAPAIARAPKRSWIRRNWWIVPVSVVVAGGVAVGLGLGLTRSGPCAGAGACVAVPAN